MAGAPDSNALTIGDIAKLSNDPVVREITMSLYKTNNLIKDIPFISSAQMKMIVKRVQDLQHTVNWGKLNQVGVVTKTVPTDYVEAMYLVREQFQIDKRLMKDPNRIEDPMDFEYRTWNEAFNYDFNDKYINNDHQAGNADSIVGLKYRLNNPTEFGIIPEMLIDGAGVDLTQAGLTGANASANANNIIELVQQTLDFMGEPEGNNCVLYANDLFKRRFERAIRMAGPGSGFAITKDTYDQPVSSYKACKFRDVGRKADQITRVIPSYETAGGATGVKGTDLYTSFYVVRYGADRFTGWHDGSLVPENLGLDPTNGIFYNAVVDYGVGLLQRHTRAIARVYDIKVNVTGASASN